MSNATNETANNLNQYSEISEPSEPSVENLSHDLDGNLLTNGVWAYTWDCENRLVAAYSNSVCVVSNAYDHSSRRVQKFTPSATHTFIYDGWNLIMEIQHSNIPTFQSSTNHFVWGKDLSGTLQGAGGVGGLLAVQLDGTWYFPLFDANGNITAYVDENGVTAASYTYDAFGATLAQTGTMADAFPHRFSTKYHDPETGLYYYGYRFYSPDLHRWLNRDPIEEDGGLNIYGFCLNNAICNFDVLGNNRYITQFDILNYGGSGGTHLHVGVAVDKWKCNEGKWEKIGIATFDFQPENHWWNYIRAVIWVAKGKIIERSGLCLEAPITLSSTPKQDKQMLEKIHSEQRNPPFYYGAFFNCLFWSIGAINYGMQEK